MRGPSLRHPTAAPPQREGRREARAQQRPFPPPALQVPQPRGRPRCRWERCRARALHQREPLPASPSQPRLWRRPAPRGSWLQATCRVFLLTATQAHAHLLCQSQAFLVGPERATCRLRTRLCPRRAARGEERSDCSPGCPSQSISGRELRNDSPQAPVSHPARELRLGASSL